MELLYLSVVVLLLNFIISVGLLIVFINFGVFPRPEDGQFAAMLYWRKDVRLGGSTRTGT